MNELIQSGDLNARFLFDEPEPEVVPDYDRQTVLDAGHDVLNIIETDFGPEARLLAEEIGVAFAVRPGAEDGSVIRYLVARTRTTDEEPDPKRPLVFDLEQDEFVFTDLNGTVVTVHDAYSGNHHMGNFISQLAAAAHHYVGRGPRPQHRLDYAWDNIDLHRFELNEEMAKALRLKQISASVGT